MHAHTQTHTLRTVFFFGDKSSTRFCDSIPDVFCRNKNKTKKRGRLVFGSLYVCVKGTVRARAAVWIALDTRVPQTQPRKGNHYDF